MGKEKIDSGCPECCIDGVVSLEPGQAKCMAILNFLPFTPGWGTMISACLTDGGFVYHVFMCGFLQWFFSGMIFGYIWSILHGCWLLDAKKRGGDKTDPML